MTYVFWVTADCNLNCRYCYEGSDKKSISMSDDIVDQTISFIDKIETELNTDKLIIPIHGGEPFLEFNKIKMIVSKIKGKFTNKNISFVTTTNGTILNDEIIKFIKDEIPDITISIDGAKSTHDKMRPFKSGKGSHDIVIQNARKVLKEVPNIRIRVTFDSKSVHELYNDIKFLIDEGFKTIVPAPNLYDNNWNELNIDILSKEMLRIKEYIQSKDDVFVSILDKNVYSRQGKCNGGKNSFHIYSDGKIYPCTFAAGNDEFCIGDIYEGIDENKRDNILSYSNDVNKSCEGCNLYDFCSTSKCKIKNKLITGDYLSAPPMQCALENIMCKLNISNYDNL